MFHKVTKRIKELIVFNGYLQHNNFNQSIDYLKSNNGWRRTIFCSTKRDKTVPYEFTLLEYKRLRSIDPLTYMYISNGNHSFSAYDSADFAAIKELQHSKIRLGKHKTSSNLDGLIANDSLYQAYYFRRRIGRKYRMKKEFLALKPSRRDINWINRTIESNKKELVSKSGGEIGEIKGNLIFSDGKKTVIVSVVNPFVDPFTMKHTGGK